MKILLSHLVLLGVLMTACSSPRSLCYQQADVNDMCSVTALMSVTDEEDLRNAGLLLCLQSIQGREKCREETALPILPWAP